MKYEKYLNQFNDFSPNSYVVITGANSGIGFSIAKQLAYKKAHIVMACRDEGRAEKAKNEILKEVPDAKIDFIQYDLSDFSSIRNFAKTIEEKYEKIDYFVFNAGIYHPGSNDKTKEGFSLTIGTNLFGLVETLECLKLYISKRTTRVVVIGSLAQKCCTINDIKNNISDTNCSPFLQYQYSKFGVMTCAYAFHEKYGADVALAEPGVSGTNITRGFGWFIRTFGPIALKLVHNPPSKASLSATRICLEGFEGLTYYVPRGLFSIAGYPKRKKVKDKNIKNAIKFYDGIVKIISNE